MNTLSKAERRAALIDLGAARFENSFVRELPGDPESRNVPRAVRNACYTRVEPTPVTAPRLLAWAGAVGEMLGIAPPASPTGLAAEALGGNRVLPGMQPYSARYGGHQFGTWAGQLGDGRAITLAEIVGPDGARRDLQLKGAGPTPYSRTADGRAVLRSSVREFLCSEAMHHLGVPTTRALSLVGTGDAVVRDMFYDGNPRPEPGAIVCRVSPSFVRFGNFEILAASQETDLLRRLADYVIDHHFRAQFPAQFPERGAPSPEIYARWFEEICRRTATLIVEWMRVGFVHGVMNTDNMSILGLTIDYGPYGWLEGYDPQWTPNTTDAEGRRYCYGNQPGIAQWNLVRLANAIYPLVDDKEPLERGLAVFTETFENASARMLADKLGFDALDREGDDGLMGDLFGLLGAVETDVTLFHRGLAAVPLDEAATDGALIAPLERAFYADDARAPDYRSRLAGWLRRYAARARQDGTGAAARAERMNRVNPKYVPRNYLAQQAIDALETGDASFLERLMKVLERPYDEQPEHDELADRRPEWARHKAGCSALSCSS
jgi:uncharacterized protein YdiU (UPF0061 family)